MISYAATAIVPEGTGAIGATGPRRRDRHRRVPRRQLRARTPARARAQPALLARGIARAAKASSSTSGSRPRRSATSSVAGRLSIARDLLPADAEALPPRPAVRLRLPREPAPDDLLRHRSTRAADRCAISRRAAALVHALDTAGLVRRTLGRLAIPAHGLIPPGLLGYSASGPSSGARLSGDSSAVGQLGRGDRVARDRRARGRPCIRSSSASSRRSSTELSDAFREIGYRIRPVNRTMAEYLKTSDAARRRHRRSGAGRRTIPTADTFLYGVLHSSSGAFRHYLELAGARPPGRAGPGRDRPARPPLRLPPGRGAHRGPGRSCSRSFTTRSTASRGPRSRV